MRSLQYIVDFLPDCIADGHIEWIEAEYGKVDHWMEKMRGNEWCDQNFIQLVSIYFNRKIIIFPVFPQNECDRNIIDPHDNCNCGEQVDESTTPFSLLYYEETHFVSAHYQSIRPKPNSQNSVATSSKAKPKSKVKKVAKSTETVDIDKSNIIIGKRKRK